jgi:hypothetical protein
MKNQDTTEAAEQLDLSIRPAKSADNTAECAEGEEQAANVVVVTSA